MLEKLENELSRKVNKEYDQFIASVKNELPDNLIDLSYEITVKNELNILCSRTGVFDKYQIKALLNEDNTIEFLYQDWMNSDYGIHNVLEDNCYDAILDLTDEYIKDIEDKVNDDKNCDLIKNISKVLSDFDNYNFCDNLKSRYELEDFAIHDVYEIWNSKNGKKELYYLFNDLKDNEHLQYLNEILVVNSENYNDITNKILPSLNKIMKEELNAESNKKMKDVER